MSRSPRPTPVKPASAKARTGPPPSGRRPGAPRDTRAAARTSPPARPGDFRRPPLGLGVAGALWLAVLIAWAGGAIHSGGEAAFALVAAGAAAYVITVAASLAAGHQPLAASRRVIALLVVVLTPVVFDSQAYLGWNSVKLAVVGIGAALLLALWAIQWAGTGPPPRLRNGLHWLVVAFVGWTALATLTSTSPILSFVGRYDFFNGLGLLLGLVVIFFAVAADFGVDDIRPVLSAAYLGAGSVVVFYGLLQLHDRLTSWGGRWEWAVHDVSGSFDPHKVIWSTFGNPNHLSGYLAVLLPIGAVLLVIERNLRTRVATALVGAGALLELVQTATRGAWIAAFVSLALVAVLLVRETGLRRRGVMVGAAGMVAVVALTAALSASGHMRYSVSDITGGGGSAGSTATARLEYWRATLKIAAAHPLVGTGPDTFASEIGRAQSAKLASIMGPESAADGPHNLILEYLATLGFPGFALFLGILGLAGWRGWRGWRAHRAPEVGGPEVARQEVARSAVARAAGPESRPRLLLVALGAGLVAYVIQAAFDVSQIALAATFWAFLALLCVATSEPQLALAPAATSPAGPRQRGSNARNRGRRRPATDQIFARQMSVALVAVVVAIAVTIAATRPYLAAKAFRLAIGYAHGATQAAGAGQGQIAALDFAAADRHFRHALALDPYDADFLESRAEFLLTSAGAASLPPDVRAADVRQAESLLRRAARLNPGNARLDAWRAAVLTEDATGSGSASVPAQQVGFLRQAVRDNPRAPEYAVFLGRVLSQQGQTADALAAIRRALTSSPGDQGLVAAERAVTSGRAPDMPALPVNSAIF